MKVRQEKVLNWFAGEEGWKELAAPEDPQRRLYAARILSSALNAAGYGRKSGLQERDTAGEVVDSADASLH